MKSQKKKNKTNKQKKNPWQWVLQFSRYRSTQWQTSPRPVLVSSYSPGIPVAKSIVSSVLKLFHIFAVFGNIDDFIETFPPLLGFSFSLPDFLLVSVYCGSIKGLPRCLSGKEPPTSTRDARDSCSNPGARRSPVVENGNLLQCSCLEIPWTRRAWWATVHGVAKWLSDWAHSTSWLSYVTETTPSLSSSEQ